MSRLLVLTLLLLLETCVFVQAQRVATGEVFAADTNEPLPVAAVTVITLADSSLWSGITTNENGVFSVPIPNDRDVSIYVRMLGYATPAPVIIQAGKNPVQVPRIFMTENALLLEGITVQAEKPLFEILPDKLVINVDASPIFAGRSALFALQQTPGIIVNPNGTITANGKNGVSIMLNGRIVKISPEMAGSFLDGLSGSTIKKIEFLQNPDASLDAEGEAGIINVITSDAVVQGFNGSVFTTAGYGWKPKLGFGGNGTYAGERIQVSAQYSFNRNYTTTYWDNFFDFSDDLGPHSVTSYNKRDETNTDQSLTFQADYRLTNKTTIGLNVIWNVRDHGYASGKPSTVETTLKRNGMIEDYSKSTYAERNKWNRYIGNMNLRHQINKRASLSADVDYLYSLNNIPVVYTFANDHTSEAIIRSKKYTPINTFGVKVDHQYIFENGFSINAGIKYSSTTFLNTFNVDSLLKGQWIRDEGVSSQYRYNERVPAAYLSIKAALSSRDELSAGLRYESTQMEVSGSEGVVTRRFLNIFPHLSITRNIEAGRSLTTTVSRRINRPSYWDLAPFAIFLGPNVFVAGNETLRPSLNNSATINYTTRTLSITINANLNNYSISNYQVRLVPDRKMISANAQNLERGKSLHVAVAMPARQIFRIWESTNNVTVFGESVLASYSYLNSSKAYFLAGVRLSSSNTVHLPRAWKLEINGNYSSSTLAGTSKHLGFGTVGAGIGKQLKNTSINVNISDLLWSWRWNRITVGENFNSEMKYLTEPRVVGFTIRRNVGNQRVNALKKRSTATEEELLRM